jgi:hypothetical protein
MVVARLAKRIFFRSVTDYFQVYFCNGRKLLLRLMPPSCLEMLSLHAINSPVRNSLFSLARLPVLSRQEKP